MAEINRSSKPARRWQIDLPSAHVTIEPRNVGTAFRRISDYLAPFGGGAPHLELLARFLGGEWFEATVAASVDATAAGDTPFAHGLGRVPSFVMLSVPIDGGIGGVRGLPAGGDGTTGVNVTAWTRSTFAVRASVTGDYQFIVL